jgi:hypothetical protein
MVNDMAKVGTEMRTERHETVEAIEAMRMPKRQRKLGKIKKLEMMLVSSSDESSVISSGGEEYNENAADYFDSYPKDKYAHLYDAEQAENEHLDEMNKIKALDIKLHELILVIESQKQASMDPSKSQPAEHPKKIAYRQLIQSVLQLLQEKNIASIVLDTLKAMPKGRKKAVKIPPALNVLIYATRDLFPRK